MTFRALLEARCNFPPLERNPPDWSVHKFAKHTLFPNRGYNDLPGRYVSALVVAPAAMDISIGRSVESSPP